MKVIGLTGGIASGKSTVSRMLLEAGIPVIDADLVAREVVEPGTKGLEQLVETFGKEILQEDGTLNRAQLGQIIFTNPEQREVVNQILQPIIRETFEKRIANYSEAGEAIIVLDLPLLYEMHYETLCDEVIVVWVHQRLQIHRLEKRNGFTKEEAMQRIQSQMPLKEKKDRADIVFDNTKTLENLIQQVQKWLEKVKNDIL